MVQSLESSIETTSGPCMTSACATAWPTDNTKICKIVVVCCCSGLGTTKFVSYEDKHWHTDCFVCSMCRISLVGKGFVLSEKGAILCPDCD
jgi:LIM domain